MYFWNTKALAHELAQDTLKPQHYKNYYLIGAVVISLVYYLAMFNPYFDVRVALFECVMTVMIMVVGVQSAYQANGGDTGRHFINRVTALSFPILIKTTLWAVLFGLLIAIIYVVFDLEGSIFDLWYEWLVSGFTILMQLVFFTRLRFYLKKVADKQI